MKYLRGINELLIYDPKIEGYFPDEISIYTTEGNWTLKKGDLTREADILRVMYNHNTAEDGNVLKDGEPDICGIDLHFVKNENGIKTIVNITYGDQMKSEFAIEKPNKINVNHYNGWNSKADSNTHFAFEDKTISDFVKLFNSFNFGYNLTNDDFKFLDKKVDSYVNETIKLTPIGEGEILLIIDNSKSGVKNHLFNLTNYLKSRGVNFEIATSLKDLNRIKNTYKIIGAISTDSDYRVTESLNGAYLSFKSYETLNCPILGIGYGMQTMTIYYGGSCKDYGELIQKHSKLTEAKTGHHLFKDISFQNTEFSFYFHDIIVDLPAEFKVLAMHDDVVVAIGDDRIGRWGLLFHPEDKEMTFPILDNFIQLCKGVPDEQKKLLQGKFEHILNFIEFKSY